MKVDDGNDDDDDDDDEDDDDDDDGQFDQSLPPSLTDTDESEWSDLLFDF